MSKISILNIETTDIIVLQFTTLENNSEWTHELMEKSTDTVSSVMNGEKGCVLALPPNIDFTIVRRNMNDVKKKKSTITLDIGYFEHLLNCLANQKFIDDINADALDCDYKSIQKENQKVIDKAWTDGMEMLSDFRR